MLDLEPSQVPGSGDRLEDREIRSSDNQGTRFPATHGTTSDAGVGLNIQHTAALNSLHYLWPGPLGTWMNCRPSNRLTNLRPVTPTTPCPRTSGNVQGLPSCPSLKAPQAQPRRTPPAPWRTRRGGIPSVA